MAQNKKPSLRANLTRDALGLGRLVKTAIEAPAAIREINRANRQIKETKAKVVQSRAAGDLVRGKSMNVARSHQVNTESFDYNPIPLFPDSSRASNKLKGKKPIRKRER